MVVHLATSIWDAWSKVRKNCCSLEGIFLPDWQLSLLLCGGSGQLQAENR